MRKQLACLSLVLGIFLLSSCTNSDHMTSMEDLQVSPTTKKGKDAAAPSTINGIRRQALIETASALSSQYALLWRSEEINHLLDRRAAYLNRIFNFQALELDHNVIPPVLVSSENEVALSEDQVVRIAQKTYKIISPPRFVTTASHWETYLRMHYSKPEKPDPSLLPQTREEVILWNKTVATSWQEGIQQADQIFARNLARLQRDYNGMALYHALLAQQMITPTYVATTDLGITSHDHGNELRIGDRVLRITGIPTLEPNSSTWTPALETADQK